MTANIVSDHGHIEQNRLLRKRRECVITAENVLQGVQDGVRGCSVDTDVLVIVVVAEVVLTETEIDRVNRAINVGSIVAG